MEKSSESVLKFNNIEKYDRAIKEYFSNQLAMDTQERVMNALEKLKQVIANIDDREGLHIPRELDDRIEEIDELLGDNIIRFEYPSSDISDKEGRQYNRDSLTLLPNGEAILEFYSDEWSSFDEFGVGTYLSNYRILGSKEVIDLLKKHQQEVENVYQPLFKEIFKGKNEDPSLLKRWRAIDSIRIIIFNENKKL